MDLLALRIAWDINIVGTMRTGSVAKGFFISVQAWAVVWLLSWFSPMVKWTLAVGSRSCGSTGCEAEFSCTGTVAVFKRWSLVGFFFVVLDTLGFLGAETSNKSIGMAEVALLLNSCSAVFLLPFRRHLQSLVRCIHPMLGSLLLRHPSIQHKRGTSSLRRTT